MYGIDKGRITTTDDEWRCLHGYLEHVLDGVTLPITAHPSGAGVAFYQDAAMFLGARLLHLIDQKKTSEFMADDLMQAYKNGLVTKTSCPAIINPRAIEEFAHFLLRSGGVIFCHVDG